jgi:hypothetical protein
MLPGLLWACCVHSCTARSFAGTMRLLWCQCGTCAEVPALGAHVCGTGVSLLGPNTLVYQPLNACCSLSNTC